MGFLDIKRATKSYGAVKILTRPTSRSRRASSWCWSALGLRQVHAAQHDRGLEEVTSGDIAIKGRSMTGVRPAERNIAMVFQSYALYPNMNVGQNIVFGLEMHGCRSPSATRR